MDRIKKAQMGHLDSSGEHQDILSSLKQDFSKNPVGRTYLFTGPVGVGKKETAMSLAQFLLCQNYPNVCGQCSSCMRAEKRAHEGLLVVEPQQAQIRIDEARNVLDFLSFQSLSRFRVVIIHDAHRLNLAAANSLLKILEEPPANCFFFLVTPTPSMMLATIRSRSLRVHFRPQSLRLALEVGEQESNLWSTELVNFLQKTDLLTETGWREQLKDRETYAQRLGFWMELLRDTVCSAAEDLILRKNLKPILLKLKEIPAEKLQKAFLQLLAFERELVFNRDPVLMTEQFIVEMKPSVVVK